VLPAVDVGRSVSRVGGKAQLPAYRALAGDLKLAYAQFEELESFARFGARLDPRSRAIIERGRRIRTCLKQSEFAPVPMAHQIIILEALTEGLFDVIEIDRVVEAERAVREAASRVPDDILQRLSSAGTYSSSDRQTIVQIAREGLVSQGLIK